MVYTLECGYRGCVFQTGDHMPSNQGYHKWLLENHFGNKHTVPPLDIVDGAVDRDCWNTFVEWLRHYTAFMENNKRSALQIRLGAVAPTLYAKLGDAYYELSELDLLLEVMKITRAQPEQSTKQEQQVGDMIHEVPCKGKEKTIGAKNRFKAGEVTVNKQEVTIGTGNVVVATRVPVGVILKVHKRKLKVLKSDLKPDPKPDPKSYIKKPDLKSDLKSDRMSSKPVEVAAELVRWAKLTEPVLVKKPRTDHDQEAAEDNAGRADNKMVEAKAEEETVNRGSGTVSFYAIKNMSNEQGEPVGVINKQGKPVGEIAMQGEPAEKSVKLIIRGMVEDRIRVVTNTEEEPAEEQVETTVVGMVGASARVVTNTEEESAEEQVENTVVEMVGTSARVVTNIEEEPAEEQVETTVVGMVGASARVVTNTEEEPAGEQ
jgi:hypothetical protein